MNKRHLIKTTFLAGLAAVFPGLQAAKGNIFGVKEFSEKEANAVLIYKINDKGICFLGVCPKDHLYLLNMESNKLFIRTKTLVEWCTGAWSGDNQLSKYSVDTILKDVI